MSRATKTKGAYSAVFAADGGSLYCNGLRKVSKHRLTDRPGRAPRMDREWSVGVTHSSWLALSTDQTVLIVTDTSGGHHGLSAQTGDVVWRTEPEGEGYAGLILPDGSFAFCTRNGLVRRLDPTTGDELWRNELTDHLINHPCFSIPLNWLIYYGVVPPADRHSPPVQTLRKINLVDGRSDILRSARWQERMALSPDGRSIYTRSVVLAPDPDPHGADVRIEDSSSGQVKARHFIPHGAGYVRVICWSSDGRFVCHGDDEGFWFLNATNLQPVALVPFSYAESFAFSADGSLMFLSGWEGSVLLRASDLEDFSVPQRSL